MNFRDENKRASLPGSERHRTVAMVLIIIGGMIGVVNGHSISTGSYQSTWNFGPPRARRNRSQRDGI